MIDINDSNTKQAAFKGGNIEWSKIPVTGDVYDFGSFWAYHDGQNWFVAYWSSGSALAAQSQLIKLTRSTQQRLKNQ